MIDCATFFATVASQGRFLGLDWSLLTVIGLTGNLFFSMRFLTQWVASERCGKSIIPTSFWYWSLGGSFLLGIYFCCRRDPVGILATVPNALIYFRNLQLLRATKERADE